MKRKVEVGEPKVSLVLDSGAFSAWRQRKPIDLDKYAEYLKANKEYYHTAVNLDVIPGQIYRKPSNHEVEASAKQGFDNCDFLEKQGLHVMPVFHQGEDEKWLRKMLKKYDYIGISPDNGKSLIEKEKWLDEMFAGPLTNKDGKPIVKTHGFGMTAIHLMFKYPWYSCDSMTWLLAASYGGIFLPLLNRKTNELLYDGTPKTVKISDKSPTRFDQGKHYNHLPESARYIYDKFFMDEGFDPDRVATDFVARTTINARVLQRIASNIKPKPFTGTSWFTEHSEEEGKLWDFHLIFAVNFSRKYSEILTNENITERLFTYYLLKDGPSDVLRDYYYTGLLPGSLKAADLSLYECHDCNGVGLVVDSTTNSEGFTRLMPCSVCNGSGDVPSTDLVELENLQR